MWLERAWYFFIDGFVPLLSHNNACQILEFSIIPSAILEIPTFHCFLVTCTCRRKKFWRERRLQSEHSCRLHQMHHNKRFSSSVMSAYSCFQRLPALLLSSQRSSRLTNLFGMHPGQDLPCLMARFSKTPINVVLV